MLNMIAAPSSACWYGYVLLCGINHLGYFVGVKRRRAALMDRRKLVQTTWYIPYVWR